jgi:hypothetical protein
MPVTRPPSSTIAANRARTPTPDAAGASNTATAANDAPQVSEDLGLPVTRTDAPLNIDGSLIGVHEKARPKATLGLDEILRAPAGQQDRLLWRFVGAVSLRAGLAIGKTSSEVPDGLSLSRAGATAEVGGGKVKLSLDGDGERTIDLAAPNANDGVFALRVLERLLLKDGAVDGDAARLFLGLLGPGGALTGPAVDDDQRFTSPKLICWDFNGTLERHGDGRTRPGLPVSTSTLRRRGAVSALTTSIGPEKPERFLEENAIDLVGYFGGKEVRPTRGPKAYAGVLRAHGVPVDEARHLLGVVGDSKTDIPSDVPGVVFFHNSAVTPAPAVELLLAELDRVGGGSLADGLESVLGGLPDVGDEKRAQLGAISFTVEMRNGGDDANPNWCPTVHEVRVDYAPHDLAARLEDVPPKEDLDARARWRLAVEHLGEAFDEARVPALLDGLQGQTTTATAVGAIDRRLAWRQHEVGEARKLAAGLEGWLSAPLSAKAEAGRLAYLLALGDGEVAGQLEALAPRLAGLIDQAEPANLAALEAHADAVTDLVDKAKARALPVVPGAPRGSDDAMRVLERAARAPVPLDGKRQEEIREALAAVIDAPRAGTGPLLEQIATKLGESLHKAKQTVGKLFAERRAQTGALAAQLTGASALATQREAAHDEMAAAVERARSR